jgi:hypothetical protein
VGAARQRGPRPSPERSPGRSGLLASSLKSAARWSLVHSTHGPGPFRARRGRRHQLPANGGVAASAVWVDRAIHSSVFLRSVIEGHLGESAVWGDSPRLVAGSALGRIKGRRATIPPGHPTRRPPIPARGVRQKFPAPTLRELPSIGERRSGFFQELLGFSLPSHREQLFPHRSNSPNDTESRRSTRPPAMLGPEFPPFWSPEEEVFGGVPPAAEP